MIVIDVAPGVTMRLATPADAREEAEASLPSFDVSAVPGARVVVRRGFASDAMTVRAACVIAPSDRWAPGLEELVLGRATGVAQASVGVPVERWEAGSIVSAGARFEQRVIGRTEGREVAAIAHTLGFVGAEHEVLLCSLACASRGEGARAASAGGHTPDVARARADATGSPRGAEGVTESAGASCENVLGSSVIEGPLAGPPPPSLLVRAVLGSAERPYEAGGVVAALSVIVIAVLLVTRPRVPGRRLFP